MQEKILNFVNKLESYKTAIKNLHWSSSNMNEHKLFDDIASSVSDIQDEISEIEQGLHGQIEKNKLKPSAYTISSSKEFLKDLLNSTNEFYKTIGGEEYIGMRSSVENFLGEINKFQYLLNLCLKEDLKRKITNKINEQDMKKQIKITENDLHNLIKESVTKILKEGMSSDYDVYEQWEELVQNLGAEAVLEEIYQMASTDQIMEWIDDIKRSRDLDYYEDDEEMY